MRWYVGAGTRTSLTRVSTQFCSPSRTGSRALETSVIFAGLPAIVPSARRFVLGILAGSPRADDMELITGN